MGNRGDVHDDRILPGRGSVKNNIQKGRYGRFRLALFGDHAKKSHCRDGVMKTCLMCGDLCAVRMVNELFGNGAGKKGAGKKKRK